MSNFLKPDFKNMPGEMVKLNQWVVWRAEKTKDGKLTKVPYNARTGKKASSTNSNTWGAWSTAVKACTENSYDGVGFVLSEDDPFVGFDFDHCWNEWGCNSECQPMVAKLNTYSEISPSGTGLRVIAKGQLPQNGRKKGPVEMYDSARFLTITGHIIPNAPPTIESRPREIKKIHRQVFSEQKGDAAILKKAFDSVNGQKIRALYDGDIDGYPSQSEADMALCNHLAFWLNQDSAAIDRAFRSSGLFRKKWDEKHYSDGRTYGQETINRAIEAAEERAAIQAEPHLQSKPNANKKPRGVTLAELKKEFEYGKEIKFLWREHIPQKMPVMISGREGQGKTTNALWIGKEIVETTDAGFVVWLATEGAVIDTVDKMNALGIDNPRFVIAQKADGSFKFNFDRHADRKELDTLLTELAPPILAVFIDSIRGMSKFGDNDDAIGGVMHDINAIVCDAHKAALVYIDHHKKGKTDNKLDKVCGTTAKTSAVRIVYSVEKKSAVVCSIEPSKINIFKEIQDLKSIKMGKKIVISQADVVSDETMTGKAEIFLTRLFSKNSEMYARDVYRMGEDQGLTDGVIKRAKANLGCIIVDRLEGNGPWIWKMKIA